MSKPLSTTALYVLIGVFYYFEIPPKNVYAVILVVIYYLTKWAKSTQDRLDRMENAMRRAIPEEPRGLGYYMDCFGEVTRRECTND